LLWNPGQLPPEWTVEKLTEKHSSRPYNPDVANAFFRAGMIEAWGRGIERIIEACGAAGVPAPELRYERTGLWVEFAYRVTAEVPDKPREKTRIKPREKTRDKILELIAADPKITTEEMAERIGITRKGIEWQIGELKRTGRLQRIGPAKGGRWEVLESHDE
jgi:ATP-dependent DNA helicase RecG